jgi:hypothetical protein
VLKRLRSNKLYVPLITILGSVALFLAYSIFYVSWQRNYANERAFRLLAVAGDQLGKRVENIKNVLAASLAYSDGGSGKASRDPAPYFKASGYEDQISVIDYKAPCSDSWKRKGKLKLYLNDDPEFSLRAQFYAISENAKEPEPCYIKANVKLAVDLRERFHSVMADYFDDILIATSEGDVLFENNVSGIRITSLDVLVAPRAPGSGSSQDPDASDKNKAKTDRNPKPFSEIGQFSNVTDVKLAGSPYKLYVQPVPLEINTYRRTAAAKTGQQGEAIQSNEPRQTLKTLICGLWRADRQQSEIVSVPNSTLIWGVLVVLAVFGMVWPLLKVAYMSPAERLKRAHVLYLLSSTLFVTAILTVIVLNCAYNVRAGDESREQLQSLASEMDRNIRAELTRSLALMKALDDDNGPVRALMKNSTTQAWTSAGVLGKQLTLDSYPYFDNVFWADRSGNQLYKLTVREEATPQTSVKDQSYFQDVRDSHHLKSLCAPPADNPGAPCDPAPFRFEARYSPNTGEFFVVLAQASNRGQLPERFKDLTERVLVTRFLSLVEPVIPTGFGFAVVDHDGVVQFHSTAGRNQIEDFFKESRENPVLKAMVISGTSDFIDVDYNGRSRLMLVKPLDYLADPALTLIVFRDTNYFTTVNVACMLVFSLLGGLFSLPFLIGLAIYVFRPVAYPLEHVWPHARNASAYFHVIAANVCLGAVFVIQFSSMETDRILPVLAVILVVIGLFAVAGSGWAQARDGWVGRAVVLAAIVAVAWPNWILLPAGAAAYLALSWPRAQGATPARIVNALYLVAVFSLLAVVVVLPCFGLFKISYHSVNRVALETAQRERLDLLKHRAATATEYFKTLARESRSTDSEKLIHLRINEPLDRYDNSVFRPAKSVPLEAVHNISNLEQAIAWAAGWFPSNGFGAQMRENAMADADGTGPHWKQRHDGDDDVLVWQEKYFAGIFPEGQLAAVYPMWQLPLPAAGLLVLLALILMVWLRYLIRKVFLTDLAQVPPLDCYWEVPDSERNLLIIGHPKSGKSERAKELENADIVDLAHLAAVGKRTLPALSHPTVVLDNFEFDIDNPETCLNRLKFLEDLLHVRKKRVIVITTVDPLFYVTAGAPEIVTPHSGKPEPPSQILDRWAAVLSTFAKLEMQDRTSKYIDDFIGERNRDGKPCPPELVEMITEECKYTPQLRKLAILMIEAHAGKPPVCRAALVEELLDRADAYYRVLWSTCTRDERLVLFQLAKDGWANPKNERAIQQLERRHLVRRFPGLRIMNESFCRFVKAAQLPGEVAKWEEEEQHSAWRTLKMGLTTAALMAGAWLLYTQQEVFQTSIGYIAAMGTATGAVLGLLRSFTRAKPGGAETSG